MENSPKVGFSNDGQVVVKNRAYRRRAKNRAMLENRKSKKFYTTRRTHKRVGKTGKVKIVSIDG